MMLALSRESRQRLCWRLAVALGTVFLLAVTWAAAWGGSGAAGESWRAGTPHVFSQFGSLARPAAAVVRVGDGSGSAYTVAPGAVITVPVEVAGAVNLAAATVVLTYDAAVVRAVACVGPVSPAFSGGLCNSSHGLGAVKFNVVSPVGVNGVHRLYEIAFLAVGGGVGATQTGLTLTVAHFADPLGTPLAVGATGGSIALVGGPAVAAVRLAVGDGLQSSFVVTPGHSIDIPLTVNVSDTRKLGAATVLLRYDPAVLRPTRCAAGDGPLMGYCNPVFDPLAGLVKLNVVAADGLNGAARLGDVTFEPTSWAAAGAASDLVLVVQHLADVTGAVLSWQAINGSLIVAVGPANSALLAVGQPGETYSVAYGLTTTVSIYVTDVVGFGAASFTLQHDPGVMRAVGCAVRDNVVGGADGGACLLKNGVTRASIVASAGITGVAPLLDVIYTPATGAAIGMTSSLALAVENFVDTQAQPLPSRVRNGEIHIGAGGPAQPLAFVRVAPDGGGGDLDLPRDGTLAVSVTVEAAVELGAATVALDYDPAIVRAIGCSRGGDFAGGYCNVSLPGRARLNVVAETPFAGDRALGAVMFRAAEGAPVGSRSGLTLTVLNLDNLIGAPLLYQALSGGVVITDAAGYAPQAVVRVGAGAYQVGIGGLVHVPISATIDITGTAQRLGVATLILGYDPAAVSVISCEINDDPAANGFAGGLCNPAFAPGQIKLNVVSLAGVAGECRFADLVFRGVGGGITTSLTLTVGNLADLDFQPLTYRVEPGIMAVTGTDDDGDGIGSEVEAGVGPGGDGNQDGLLDAEQPNVTSLPNAVDGAYITLASPPGTSLREVCVQVNPSPEDAPADLRFPVGAVSFKVTGIESGGATTVTLLLPPDRPTATYYKHGPTPDGPLPHWYAFAYDGAVGAQISGSQIILSLVDGLRGDGDLTANGTIADPGAPAVQSRPSPATSGSISTITASRNPQEPGLIPGVPILALDSAGVKVAQTLTDDAGRYLLAGLPAGILTVALGDLPGYGSVAGQQMIAFALGDQVDGVNFGIYALPTSAVLQGFSARWEQNAVRLSWSILAGGDVHGFHVWRSLWDGGPYKRLTHAAVPARGQGGGLSDYTWADASAAVGPTYWYRLEMVPGGEIFGPVRVTLTVRRIFLPILGR